MRRFPPERIVCLTEETVRTLYLLGEQDRIVGVSGYAVRPPQVRREKPRVSAFTNADIPKILALAPDLVLAFSEMKAGIVADLARAGVAVHFFNQRYVAGILAMIRTVGILLDAGDRAEALAGGYEERLATVAERARGRPRPRVYFEEWDEPLISGIGWVSELVRIAGSADVFPELARQPAAKDNIVTLKAVLATRPEVILTSWCGKKVVPSRIASRPGWSSRSGCHSSCSRGRRHSPMAWTRLFVCLAYRTEAWADQLARQRKRGRIRENVASLDLRYSQIRTLGPRSQHWSWDH